MNTNELLSEYRDALIKLDELTLMLGHMFNAMRIGWTTQRPVRMRWDRSIKSPNRSGGDARVRSSRPGRRGYHDESRNQTQGRRWRNDGEASGSCSGCWAK